MQGIMSRISDAPVEFTIAAVVVVILLLGVWKIVKGVARTVIMLAIVAAVVAMLVRMGKMDKPDLPRVGSALTR